MLSSKGENTSYDKHVRNLNFIRLTIKDSSDRSEHNHVFQTSNVIQNSKLISETVFLTINLNLVQDKNSTNLLNHSRIV